MPNTPPTPAEFKADFPEFATIGDPQVQLAIDEAGLSLDDTWDADDYTIGYKLLVAHILATGGGGTGSGAEGGVITSESIGPLRIDYQQSKSSDDEDDYGSTSYGRRFKRMIMRNSQSPLII